MVVRGLSCWGSYFFVVMWFKFLCLSVFWESYFRFWYLVVVDGFREDSFIVVNWFI